LEIKNLWHGTGATSSKLITEGDEGFDMRFCDKDGFFGPGNYFALRADYSTSGFEHIEQDGDCKGCGGVFFASVLTGDVMKMENRSRGT